MKNAHHNKKRNVGLLYEFLLRAISRATLNNDEKCASSALNIACEHFAVGTELHKEFRLFNALINTTVSSDAIAGSIIREARNAAISHNSAQLENEKTKLIHEINRSLNGDKLFYDQPIDGYKIYATVQTLINDWRDTKDCDIARRALYEDKLVEWLRKDKKQRLVELKDVEQLGIDRLAYRIMMKKLNSKFGSLSQVQKELIREYVFRSDSAQTECLIERLGEIRDSLLHSVDNALRMRTIDNEIVVNKMHSVREMLRGEKFDAINEGVIVRFMMYAKLEDELMRDD